MQPRMLGRLILLALGLGLLLGCPGSHEVETVDVSGKVALDDKPLADAMIFFITDEHTGTGKTGADGTYTLENGAVPGLNKVYLSKVEGGGARAKDEAAAATEDVEPGKPTRAIARGETLPARYSNPLNPQLEYTVPEDGTTEANFNLKSR